MLKKFALFAALIYSAVLIYLSLIKLTNVPDMGVSFADKIFHFLAYFVLTLLWFAAFFHQFNIKKRKAIIYASLFSIAFGIIIEVLQGSFTAYRVLDAYDVLANTSGVLLAVFFIVILNNIGVKNI